MCSQWELAPTLVNSMKAPPSPPPTSTLIILRSRLKSSTATRGCACFHCGTGKSRKVKQRLRYKLGLNPLLTEL